MSQSPPRKSARLSAKTNEGEHVTRHVLEGTPARAVIDQSVSSKSPIKADPAPQSRTEDVQTQGYKETTSYDHAETNTQLTETEIFATTVSQLSPQVTEALRGRGLDLLTTACSELGVRVVDAGPSVSLEGDWDSICQARNRVAEVLQSISSANSDQSNPVEDETNNVTEIIPSEEAPQTDQQLTSNTLNLPDQTLPTTVNIEVSSSVLENWDCGVNSFVCSHCDMTFTRSTFLRSHMRCHGFARKRPHEPQGKLQEEVSLRTEELLVMVDAENTKWFQCRKCPMLGSRRFRMASHFKACHTENGGVPFGLLKKTDSGGKGGVGYRNVEEENQDDLQSVMDVDVNIGDKQAKKIKPLLSRLQRKNPERVTKECEKCGYKTSAEGLRSHMRIKHSKFLYSCNVCRKSFGTLFLLRNHYKRHFTQSGELKKDQAQAFQCEKCCKKFGRKIDLVHHLKLGSTCSDKPLDPTKYHPSYVDGMFVCEVCGYTAKQRIHVVQHHARKHAPKEFSCNLCKKTFAYEKDLTIHQSVAHATIKAHKCDVCGKSFASAKYLGDHLKRHEQVKRYFCPVCEKGFLKKYLMERHLETHKQKGERTMLYDCTICGKSFTTDSYRKDHENIHSGVEPYTCKICGKTMKAQSAVWKHMQYHNSEKQYTCLIEGCKKSFRFKMGLTAHMVTHTKEGKHRCDQCGKVYTQRQTLLRHVCKTPGGLSIPVVSLADQSPPLTTDSIDLGTPSPQPAQSVYMCSECNKLFHNWEEINKHMLLHTTNIDNPHTELTGPVTDDEDNLMVQIHVLEMTDQQGEVGETGAAVVNILNPEVSIPHNEHLQNVNIADTSIHTQELQTSDIEDNCLNTQDLHTAAIADTTIHTQDINTPTITDTSIDNPDLESSTIAVTSIQTVDLCTSNIAPSPIHNQDLQTSSITGPPIVDQPLQTADIAGSAVDHQGASQEVYSMLVDGGTERDKECTYLGLEETDPVTTMGFVGNQPAGPSLDFEQRQIELIHQVTLTEDLT